MLKKIIYSITLIIMLSVTTYAYTLIDTGALRTDVTGRKITKNGDIINVIYTKTADKDIYFSNSSDNGINWNTKKIFTGTYSSVGLMAYPNGTLIMYHNNDVTQRAYYTTSNNNGSTWTTPEMISATDTHIGYDIVCELDSNNIIHCVEYTSKIVFIFPVLYLYYSNSTNFQIKTEIITGVAAGNIIDIQLTNGNTPIIVYTDGGGAVAYVWKEGTTNSIPKRSLNDISLAIDKENDKVWVSTVYSSIIYISNSTVNDLSKWTTINKTITGDGLNDIIAYDDNVAVYYGNSTKLMKTVTSNGGINWQDENIDTLNANIQEISIMNTNFPSEQTIIDNDDGSSIITIDFGENISINSDETPFIPPEETTPTKCIIIENGCMMSIDNLQYNILEAVSTINSACTSTIIGECTYIQTT